MKDHTDDIAFMNAQAWASTGRPCAVCRKNNHVVTEAGHIEQNSGPGYPILLCRNCLAWRLFFARRDAADAGREHTPTMPVLRGRNER